MNALIIMRFTIHEALRRRLVLAGVLLSLAFLGLFALGYSFLYGKVLEATGARPTRQMLAVFGATMTLLGLYAVSFLSSFMALLLTVGAIAGEVDSGALHAVLARPLRRAEYILGRWLACTGMVGLYVVAMSGAVLLIARLIAGYSAVDALRGIALLSLAAAVLVTLSLFGSTLANGVAVFSLFGVAWLAGIIEFIGDALKNEAMINLGVLVSLLVPSDALWRGASFFFQSPAAMLALAAGRNMLPFASGAPPSAPFIVWSVGYLLVLLVGATLIFARRDL
ncbi:MAG: ABC transporter permease [Chloroflexota bacterium]